MKILYVTSIFILLLSCSTSFTMGDSEGSFEGDLVIESSPTEAMIYIDGREIGVTPIDLNIYYFRKISLNIKAVPLYRNQHVQDIIFYIPPVPEKINIIMTDYNRKKIDEPIVKKEKIPDIKTEFIPVYFPEIYFDTDDHNIRNSEMDKIHDIIKVLNDHNDIKIEVIGYADIRGDEQHNSILSLRRAESVYRALTNRGIEVDRIRYTGRGRVVTFTKNGYAFEYKENRCVRIKISGRKRRRNEKNS